MVCASCGKGIDPDAGMYHSADLRRSYHPACHDALNSVPTMVILSERPPGDSDLAEAERPIGREARH
jgi:hypothetical protein